MARRTRKPKDPTDKKLKKVMVQFIPEEQEGHTPTPYVIMRKMRDAHHPQLADAKIGIAWKFGWRADSDGRVKLGQMRKGTDLDREMHGYDFVILLNHDIWNTAQFTEAQMEALVDHELCHGEVSRDQNGEPKKDDRGRICYRIRRHDVEEFREIVARHGEWKSDIEAFVTAAQNSKATTRPLFAGQEAASA